MKKKSNRLRWLEAHRWSIFTDDLKHCYTCSLKGLEIPAVDKHEILNGPNRANSMVFGYVIPLCRQCHDSFTNNHVLKCLWALKCQKYHEKKYGFQDWMDHFHKSYK